MAHVRRLRPDARVEAAAAVVAALRIGVVEIVHDARDLHALVFVQLVLEDAERTRVVVEHEVLADQAARIRQAVGKLRAFADISSRRGVSAPLAHTTTARALLEALAPRCDRSTATPVARPCLLVLDANDVALGPHFAAAGRLRFGNDGGQRRGLRHHLAGEAVAEATVHARRPAAIWLRVDRQRRRNRMQAQLARAALEQDAGRLHRQRRHRIRLGARRIERAGAGQTRHADLPLDLACSSGSRSA